jgi:photosystem II stability/assembly factor-like uncharacterized protein
MRIKHTGAFVLLLTSFVGLLLVHEGLLNVEALSRQGPKAKLPPPTPTRRTPPKSRKKNPQPKEDLQQPRSIVLKSSDTAEGSRVTINANVPLNDYSAYRRGDRFFVFITRTTVLQRSDLRGRGFEDTRLEKRGDDVLVSFRLQPGASARVDQSSNRLDIIFTAAKVEVNSPAEPRPLSVGPGWSGNRIAPGKFLRAVYFTDSKHGWIVGDNGTLIRTEDGGLNWILRPTITIEAAEISFRNQDDGFITGGEYVLFTQDGGQKWRTTLQLSKTDLGAAKPQINSLKLTSKKKGWILGVTSSFVQERTIVKNFLLHTEDGGSSWARRQLPIDSSMEDFDFVGEERGWIVGLPGTILRTLDGGSTWQVLSSGSKARLFHVDFRDSNNGIAVGKEGTVLLTSDAGENWRSVNSSVKSDLYKVQFDFKNREEAWIVGDKGLILHTADGGQTWKSESSNTEQRLVGISITATDTWVVGGDGMVLRYSR